MKTLKEKIITHAKNIGFVLAYGSIGAIIGSSFLYTLIAVDKGNIDPRKWEEIQEQRKIQQEQRDLNCYKKEFYNADKNKDFMLDSTEFFNYRKD